VPGGLTDIEAASLPETFFTVWSNVFDRALLGAGEGGEQKRCWCRAARAGSA
jgi:NADPH2:quinone reductase